MFEKSTRRKNLEKEITKTHRDAQSDAIRWLVKHPIKGIPALISMASKGEVNERVAREWHNLPSWQKYLSSYDQLEKLEREEGFPAMHCVAEQLDRIKFFLPTNCSKNAYYPFAGTDFYWARIFNQIHFEDTGYGQEYVKNMWWRPGAYQTDSINNIVALMKEARVLNDATTINKISGDANVTRVDNDFNRPDWTIIIKGGHSVVKFLDTRFADTELKFGSIIVVGPADDDADLRQGISKRSYECADYHSGRSYYAPFSMGMRHQYTFIKK